MAIGVGDILRIAVQFLVDGVDQAVNVHTFRADDLGGAADDLDFMEIISTILVDVLYDAVVGDIANNVVGTLISGVNLTENEVLPPVLFPFAGANGSVDSMARQVTALVYLNTGQSHRQGRSYLPPFAENNLDDDGQWGATTVAHLAAYGLLLLDPLTDGAAVIRRVVCHPTGSGAIVPSQAGVSLSPRTQRRRTPGRGS